MNNNEQENLQGGEISPRILPRNYIEKPILALNVAMAVIYFLVIAFLFPVGSRILFFILLAGEVFHVWQIIAYIHTVWSEEKEHERNPDYLPEVDVFITVAGEPGDIIEQTTRAAMRMQYPNFTVHVLNDGLVARKNNWRDALQAAKKYGANCITRLTPGGAKAGNINNALRETHAPFIAVFDVDHAPHEDFLLKMMGYFIDPKVAFVQSPQYYKNNRLNEVTGGAWEQQGLFFGAICRGKDALNSVAMCGTNMVLRKSALLDVGGMNEKSITEDFLTSLFIHSKGWKSIYVPEVLAEGLAPEDFRSYYNQQFRWARGSLEVIFKHNPLFKGGLTFSQKMQYLASSGFYLSGLVVLMNAALPIVFFFTGLEPFKAPTMALAAVFLPYIFLVVYTLQRSNGFTYTFRALAFSMSSFPIHIKAFFGAITNRKAKFVITSKKKLSGNFLYLVTPHLVYISVAAIGIALAVAREGLSASVVDNIAWALFNIAAFTPFIVAAMPAARPAAEAVLRPAEERISP